MARGTRTKTALKQRCRTLRLKFPRAQDRILVSLEPLPKVFTLPTKVVRHISSFLPSPSQVCLALSCKTLYKLLGSILEAHEFRFPRLLFNKRLEISFNQGHLPRNQLLIQLEDGSWAYCGKCLKLHRRGEFPEKELTRPPLERQCMPSAGIVDLCPCIALTVHDRFRIMEYLIGTTSVKRSSSLYDRRLFKSIIDEKEGRSLLHECAANEAGRINVTLFIAEKNQLIASSRYEIRTSTTLRDKEPMFLCYHRTLSQYLLYFSFLDIACAWCYLKASQLIDADTQKLVGVQSTRKLETGMWPY